MGKKLYCDECGVELTHRDMVNGEFHEIVNYHPACAHISTMRVEFERDCGMVTPAPDLCKICMVKHFLQGMCITNETLQKLVKEHEERRRSGY